MNDKAYRSERMQTHTDLDTILPGRGSPRQGRGTPAADEKNGIQFLPALGLFGVIFGSAGSGKSVLALELCCRFASKGPRKSWRPPRHAIYITQERPLGVVARAEEFANFETKKERGKTRLKIQREEELFKIGAKGEVTDGRPTVTIVHMPLDPEAQEDKLRYILGFLNKTFCCEDENDYGSARDPKTRLLLCVDNADTISPKAIKQAIDQQDYPDQPQRTFYKRLREYCARHRLNSWMVFEETTAQTTNDEYALIATHEIAYAADIVIRLGLTVFDTLYRERSIEVIKAKNQGYRRGRHHFSIRAEHKADETSKKPGIVIYKSLATQLFEMSEHSSSNRHKPGPRTHWHRLGIKEVDAAVSRMNPKQGVERKGGYLASGTVSVLVSDLDSLATELALHFALQEAVHGEREQRVDTLFITTLHRKERLLEMGNLYKALGKPIKELKTTKEKSPLRIHALDSDHVTDGKVLRDIADWIDAGGGKDVHQRVVLDNIFELQAKFPLIRNPKHFLNALLVMFRHRNTTALVVDTVEVGEGRNPLDQSFVAGMADHVFVLRHTESQSQPKKIFTVLKLAGYDEPTELWEILNREDRAYGHDLSRSYKGILSGKLEPVSVNLSLYADATDSPLDDYLQNQAEVLKNIFAHSVNFHACHPDTYVGLQHSISTAGIEALGDCHVISIDEIWLEQLLRQKKLETIEQDYLTEFGDFKNNHYVTVCEDMAMRYLGERPLDREKHPHFAIPDRNNVGVLACNPVAWHRHNERIEIDPSMSLAKWKSSKRIPEWVSKSRIDKAPTWEELAELQELFLRNLAPSWEGRETPPFLYRIWEEQDFDGPRPKRRRVVRGMPDWGVFTFSFDHREPAVSFLLELVLGRLDNPETLFERKERFQPIVDGKARGRKIESRTLDLHSKKTKDAWQEALLLLLRLLSPWDLQRLRDAWFRPCAIEMPCLFSRQWFSSAGIIGLNSSGLTIMELPVGEKSKQSIPVSGAWYLGILKGSTGVRAGAEIISHLASSKEEIYKVKRRIGMPVRSGLFKARHCFEARVDLPYRRAFLALAGAPEKRWKQLWKAGSQKPGAIFYRGRIEHYSELSSILFGVMVEAARIALDPAHKDWLWKRDEGEEKKINSELGTLVENLAERYDAFLESKE